LGEAEVIGATGVQGSGAVSDLVDAQISFATFADVTVSAPTTAIIYRGGSRASAGFTFANTTVKGSVLWHAGSMGDPNMCTGTGSTGTGGSSSQRSRQWGAVTRALSTRFPMAYQVLGCADGERRRVAVRSGSGVPAALRGVGSRGAGVG
jgi:hypothetical protein